jgi:hypothetical protein
MQGVKIIEGNLRPENGIMSNVRPAGKMQNPAAQ